jgi:hypothetical protein
MDESMTEEDTQFCGNCGTPATSEQAFCTKCGKPLAGEVSPAPAPSAQLEPPKDAPTAGMPTSLPPAAPVLAAAPVVTRSITSKRTRRVAVVAVIGLVGVAGVTTGVIIATTSAAAGPLLSDAQASKVLLPAASLKSIGDTGTSLQQPVTQTVQQYIQHWQPEDGATTSPASCSDAIGDLAFTETDSAVYAGWKSDRIISQADNASAAFTGEWLEQARVFVNQAAAQQFMQETRTWYNDCPTVQTKDRLHPADSSLANFMPITDNLGIDSIVTKNRIGLAPKFDETFTAYLRKGNVVDYIQFADNDTIGAGLSTVDTTLLNSAVARVKAIG